MNAVSLGAARGRRCVQPRVPPHWQAAAPGRRLPKAERCGGLISGSSADSAPTAQYRFWLQIPMVALGLPSKLRDPIMIINANSEPLPETLCKALYLLGRASPPLQLA